VGTGWPLRRPIFCLEITSRHSTARARGPLLCQQGTQGPTSKVSKLLPPRRPPRRTDAMRMLGHGLRRAKLSSISGRIPRPGIDHYNIYMYIMFCTDHGLPLGSIRAPHPHALITVTLTKVIHCPSHRESITARSSSITNSAALVVRIECADAFHQLPTLDAVADDDHDRPNKSKRGSSDRHGDHVRGSRGLLGAHGARAHDWGVWHAQGNLAE
jgi:hypothetical protein